jgi:hypothetical protein
VLDREQEIYQFFKKLAKIFPSKILDLNSFLDSFSVYLLSGRWYYAFVLIE